MAKAWQYPEDYQGTYRLEFADPSFKGLKVICKRHTFRSIAIAAKLLELDVEALREGRLSSSDIALVEDGIREFASVIVSWNLRVPTKDGSYTPKPNYRSLSKLDLVFVMQLFMVWLQIMVRVEFKDMNPAEIPMESVTDG